MIKLFIIYIEIMPLFTVYRNLALSRVTIINNKDNNKSNKSLVKKSLKDKEKVISKSHGKGRTKITNNSRRARLLTIFIYIQQLGIYLS